jgi:tetratricopeptide (TPR) repeat protein
MKRSSALIFVLALLAMILAMGGLFNRYNVQQQEAEQRALTVLDQGISLFHEKRYAEALAELQGIPDGVLQDWHLPYYTASAHVMLKDYQPAATKLEEALVLNPQETLILFELGVVYFKLGNLGLSKGYFASVVEIDPTNEEAKGLMDIMANLERQQPDEKEPELEEMNPGSSPG